MAQTNADMWAAARKAWPASVSRDPELREPQLSEQLEITRAIVAQHLAPADAATVDLSALKCVAEALAGRWVSQTAVLSGLLAAGFRIQEKRGAIAVFCRPTDPRLIRALRRGRIPPHHELLQARR